MSVVYNNIGKNHQATTKRIAPLISYNTTNIANIYIIGSKIVALYIKAF